MSSTAFSTDLLDDGAHLARPSGRPWLRRPGRSSAPTSDSVHQRRYAAVLAPASTVLAQVTWAPSRLRARPSPVASLPQGGEDEVFAPPARPFAPLAGPGSRAGRGGARRRCSAPPRATASVCCCRTRPGTFPLGTLLINVVGGFLIGVLIDAVAARPLLRPFAITGILGGFTTFSTYAVDTEQLLATGRLALARRRTWSARSSARSPPPGWGSRRPGWCAGDPAAGHRSARPSARRCATPPTGSCSPGTTPASRGARSR